MNTRPIESVASVTKTTSQVIVIEKPVSSSLTNGCHSQSLKNANQNAMNPVPIQFR
jgi:hypothetical protein